MPLMWGCSNLGSIFCHPLPVCCLSLRGRRFFLPAVSFTSVFRPVILSACPCLRSHLRCVRACVWHRRRATTASPRNTRESASFLRLLSTVRFSFAVRLPQLSARLLEAGQRHALPAVRHQRLQPEVQVLLQGQPLVEQPRPREGVLREGVLPLRPEAQLHGHLHG